MNDNDRDPLVREALLWFATLRDEDATVADWEAFFQWREKSNAHLAAWEKAENLWSAFSPVEGELKRLRQKTISRRTLISGCIGMLSIGVGGHFLRVNGAFADFRTGAAERRTFELTDGSSLELNASSAVSVDYTATKRQLILYKGEAYFTVTADPMRPFLVETGNGQTRALGTRFNVRTDNDFVTVTVSEHAVEVTVPGQESQRLEEGWQLSYSNGGISEAAKADLSVVESWRQGRLAYQGAPLRRVLNDIERQRGGYIVLTDTSLGELPVSAAFDVASSDEALDTISNLLPIGVLRAEGITFVYRQ